MKIDFEKAVLRLKEKDNITILTHASPDGDTVGGGFALLLALRKLGKNVNIVNNDEYPENLSYITSLFEKTDFQEEFVVSVDVADEKLLGERVLEKYGKKVDLAIDHHATNTMFAKETYVEKDSASACEIIYAVVSKLGVEISKDIANCLYTGLSTDTGCFRYSNVTPRTHEIAARLIEKGADHSLINTKMFETKKLGFFKLQTKCLENMKILYDGKVCIFTVTQKMLSECDCEESQVNAIVALSRQIEGVKIGVTIKEKENGSFKISLRTDEDVDAAEICALFSGGGHKRAAGCSFNCSLEETQKQLEEATKKFI